jgi:hypothetical protein
LGQVFLQPAPVPMSSLAAAEFEHGAKHKYSDNTS